MAGLRNPIRRPTHPGAIVREDVLPALAMTQTELAHRLGVSRLSVSELLHEKRALSPEMAVRRARLLRTSAESWMRIQTTLDLWDATTNAKLAAIKPLPKDRLPRAA